jgi:hypothetical protein
MRTFFISAQSINFRTRKNELSKTVTEQEWLTTNRPYALRYLIDGKISERKYLLYVVAWVRCSRSQTRNRRELYAAEQAEAAADDHEAIRSQRTTSGQKLLEKLVCLVAGPKYRKDHARHANLLRDIFGNPFRPMSIDPRCLTSSVIDLANGIYSERAFDRMPILADALMDGGCDSEEILNHCRADEQHVRGCWLLDLILAKS